ncbi:MAG: hypothetical protein KDJ75_02675 [Alphaproteobacteria bacterium]|nr:hypothetical protein [Alphaproteobacteria bacterium]
MAGCHKDFAVSNIPVNTKSPQEQAHFYARYFMEARDKLYDQDSKGMYNARFFQNRTWGIPKNVLRHALNNPTDFTQWDDRDRDYIPDILKVFDDNYGVSALSLVAQGYDGWKASVFYAQFFDDVEPHIIRVGAQDSLHHFSIPYMPLNQQPYARTIFSREHGETDKISQLVVERGPAPSMVDFIWHKGEPYPPPGFGEFLNNHILKNTPYEVKMHRDLCVLWDGTPVYGDPDSLRFKDPSMEFKEMTPESLQNVMTTIAQNCREVGWPEHLS